MGTCNRWIPPGRFGHSHFSRQFLYYWREQWKRPELLDIIGGRQKLQAWRRERSRLRWNEKHPEQPVQPPYQPPSTPEEEHETMMQLFMLTGQHGMDSALSWLCQHMRKIGAECGC